MGRRLELGANTYRVLVHPNSTTSLLPTLANPFPALVDVASCLAVVVRRVLSISSFRLALRRKRRHQGQDFSWAARLGLRLRSFSVRIDGAAVPPIPSPSFVVVADTPDGASWTPRSHLPSSIPSSRSRPSSSVRGGRVGSSDG